MVCGLVLVALCLQDKTPLRVLYDFPLKSKQPVLSADPGAIVEGSNGAFYGCANQGGERFGGCVFSLDKQGVLQVVYSFDPRKDGFNPTGGVSIDDHGSILGTCAYGGQNTYGTVWTVTPDGNFTLLHAFQREDCRPMSPPQEGEDGNYYGVTTPDMQGAHGVFYRVTLSGEYTVLHRFGVGDSPVGSLPWCLKRAPGHGFYGVAGGDGNKPPSVFTAESDGAVKLVHANQHGEFYDLRDITLASDGNYYGASDEGGTFNNGVILKLSPKAGYTEVYRFQGKEDGSKPATGIAMGSDGFIYGATNGFGAGYFRVRPNGSDYKVLTYRFPAQGPNSFGVDCNRAPIFGSDGKLYGICMLGGTNSTAVFEVLDPQGA